MTKKTYLIIIRSSLLAKPHGEETLELVLALASMEYNFALVFSATNAWQLTAPDMATNAASSMLAKSIAALKLFEIQDLYYSNFANEDRAITDGSVDTQILAEFPNIKLITPAEIEELKLNYDIVLSF